MLHLLALTPLLLSQTGNWVEPPNVSLRGWERLAGSEKREIVLVRSGPRQLFGGTRAVYGQLAGAVRTELINEKGVFTWVNESPRFALQLVGPSVPDLFSSMRPPRFSKSELLKNAREVGRMISQDVKVGPAEKVADRETIPTTFATGELFQKIWFDSATGIGVRQQDLQGQTLIFEREMALVEPKGEPPLALPESTVIRGIPGPDILLNVHRELDAPKDIEGVRKVIRLSDKKWIKMPPQLAGFKYVQTHFQDSAQKRETYRPRPNLLGQPEIEPGGLPPAWTAKAILDSNTLTALIQFQSPDGSAPMVRVPITGEPGGFSLATNEYELKFVVYLAPDGTFVISPAATQEDAERARRMRFELEGGAGALVQSDFLDAATGDTVTFLQMANMGIEHVLRGLSLPKPKPLPRHPHIQAYEFVRPFRMNIVSRKDGLATYSLVSSRLSCEELAPILLAIK